MLEAAESNGVMRRAMWFLAHRKGRAEAPHGQVAFASNRSGEYEVYITTR